MRGLLDMINSGMLKGLFGDEEGQGLVEYALILVLIAIVVILMLSGMGASVNNTFSSVNSALGQ